MQVSRRERREAKHLIFFLSPQSRIGSLLSLFRWLSAAAASAPGNYKGYLESIHLKQDQIVIVSSGRKLSWKLIFKD